ncbi:LLM class flavin-dependent oxidoreductase [Devosia sp. 2618]|uniref:LLM class flavin-dependent oxidoreductase n=1 Tax=Devosia sp. 2618 TaxID=3156454 RepID=UPI0033965821
MSLMNKLGAYVFPWGPDSPSVDGLVDMAQEAEAYGFDSVHLPWHFTLPRRRMHSTIPNQYMIDPLLLLTLYAARTKTIRLGLNSVLLPVHHPFVWAQHFASLDVISEGRLIAGAATGWWKEDMQVGGSTLEERVPRSNEALDVINKLWRGEPISETGKFWDSKDLVLEPRPLQDPLPFWYGGSLKALKRAAKWATGLFMMNPTPEELVEEIVPAIRATPTTIGRPLDIIAYNYVTVSDDKDWLEREIRPLLMGRMNQVMPSELASMQDDPNLLKPDGRVVWGSPEQCAEQIRRTFAAGADYMVLDFNFHGVKDLAFARQQMKDFATRVAPLLDR